MSKDKTQKKGHDGERSSQDQSTEQMRLWEINEVMLLSNYTRGQTEDVRVYYTLSASRRICLRASGNLNDMLLIRPCSAGVRSDNPVRPKAQESREEAERLAESSGRAAQQVRQAGNTYNPDVPLLSQQIANNPNMPMLTSSARRT